MRDEKAHDNHEHTFYDKEYMSNLPAAENLGLLFRIIVCQYITPESNPIKIIIAP
jgi:hypothetical protein